MMESGRRFISAGRRHACVAGTVFSLLFGVAWAGGENISLCAGSPNLPKAISAAVDRIASALAASTETMVINIRPRGSGSPELLLANAVDLVARLGAGLQTARVPARRVRFHWLLRRGEEDVGDLATRVCEGSEVLLVLNIGEPSRPNASD